MDLLIISQFFPPETNAAARRVKAIAEAVSKRHTVTVLTLEPSYPQPSIYSEKDLSEIDHDLPSAIIRTFPFFPHARPLILRGLRELFMAIRLSLYASSIVADVVLVSTPSMFLGPVAWFIAKLKKAKFVWDVRDLTWRYGRESVNGGVAWRWIAGLVEGWMESVLRRADLVVGATPGVSKLLVEEHGVPVERTLTVLNGVSRTFIQAFDDLASAPRFKTRVLYLGLLGFNHGIGILLEVARLLPDIEFILVGDGPERPMIERKLERMDLDNFTLHGYSTELDEIVAYYRDSDILFNHTKDRPVLNETVIPAKFFEYMATGKPLVYAGKGLGVEFLKPIGCAQIAEPGNPDSIARSIHAIIQDPDLARSMGLSGRRYVVDNAVREDQMDGYLSEIENRLFH